jgi:hypothetical protein
MDRGQRHAASPALLCPQVFLYDLAGKVGSVQPPRPLPRVLPSQLEDLAAAVALEHLRRQQAREQGQQQGEHVGYTGPWLEGQEQGPGAQAEGSGPAAIPDTQQLPDNAATAAVVPGAAAAGRKAAAPGGQWAAPQPQTGGGATARAAGQLQVTAIPAALGGGFGRANRPAAVAAAKQQVRLS